MDALRIRPPIERDLQELVRIYNHYVRTSHITFDTRSFSLEQRRPWFEAFSAAGPHRLLVAEVEADVIGYASSGSFKPKPAYHTSVQTTIYLDPSRVGHGFGRRLYSALLDELASEPEVHRAYGGVALPNPISVRLHRELGFRWVGTFREVGHKFGRFWDVSWFEKDLFQRHARRGGAGAAGGSRRREDPVPAEGLSRRWRSA